MAPEARADDWRILDLEPGADAAEIHAAYRRRRRLWQGEDLATYSLLLDEERSELLGRLEDAYRRTLADAEAMGVARRFRPSEDAPRPPAPSHHVHHASPGRALRLRREELGITLQEVSNTTKIRAVLLTALEAEDFGGLPAPVYVRGFVVQVARALSLPDPESLARRYVELMEADEE